MRKVAEKWTKNKALLQIISHQVFMIISLTITYVCTYKISLFPFSLCCFSIFSRNTDSLSPRGDRYAIATFRIASIFSIWSFIVCMCVYAWVYWFAIFLFIKSDDWSLTESKVMNGATKPHLLKINRSNATARERKIRRIRCKTKAIPTGWILLVLYTALYEAKLLFGNRSTVNDWF